MEGSCQPQTASTRAQVDVYRRLSHGVAPPPSVWDQAVGSASTTPVCTSSALLSQVAMWDAALLARMRARQRELAMPPPNLPTPVLQAVAIERQLPGLLQLQRRVWSDLVGHTDGTDLCSEATDSLSLRRRQRQRQPREVRESERLEKQRRIDAENRRKEQRASFLDHLLQHGEDFKAFHREARRTGHKLAKSVLQDFESKARRENKERERAQRERIKAR